MSEISTIVAGFMLVIGFICLLFIGLFIWIIRSLSQLKNLFKVNNFHLMILAQSLGKKSAAVRSSMYMYQLKEKDAQQFLQYIGMYFPNEEQKTTDK